MKLLFPWEMTTPEGELHHIESSLGSILRPVDPRVEFEGSLRRGLLSHPAPAEIELPSRMPQVVLVGVAGLLSGLTIIVLGAWVIITLMARMRIQSRRTTGPIQPAS